METKSKASAHSTLPGLNQNAAPAPGKGYRAILAAIADRSRGPGGYYNMGNLLGLVSGVAVQWMQAAAQGALDQPDMLRAIIELHVGSASAVALSLAMVVFFLSGEAYHCAWAHGFPLDARLNRRGDWLSGIGAVFLGVGLLITGQPVLAATAGLLHAVGKFGSAWTGPLGTGLWPRTWPDLWRSLVLASRIPALLAAAISLVAETSGNSAGVAMITPLTLTLCYLLWIRADLLLFESKA
jgi:hypothetical protein